MSASTFENRLAESARAGRDAAESHAASRDFSREELLNLEPEDAGFTDTEILLKITGEKTLHDEEEAEAIVGVFRDNFYDALEESV